MNHSIILFSLFLLSFCSCVSSADLSALSGEWRVVRIGGEEVTEEENAPFLGFDVKKNLLYGFTGCNRLTCPLNARTFVRGKADFSQMGMTRMLCQNDRYERPLVDALNKATLSEVSASDIKLKDAAGQVLLELEKVNSDSVNLRNTGD